MSFTSCTACNLQFKEIDIVFLTDSIFAPFPVCLQCISSLRKSNRIVTDQDQDVSPSFVNRIIIEFIHLYEEILSSWSVVDEISQIVESINRMLCFNQSKKSIECRIK